MGVGVIASSVVTATSVDVLMEPFNNFTDNAWTVSGATIVAGRTGTAAQASGATSLARYTVAAPQQSGTITVGFAWRRTDATVNARDVVQLYGESSVQHGKLRYNPTGTILSFNLGGTVLGSTTFTFAQNVWNYLEVQSFLSDTVGTAKVRINGTEVINAAALDTMGGGSTGLYDGIRLINGTGATTGQWDDLYLTMGAGAAFKGNITIP